ncbi:conjugative transfer protein MobI(A/C) [Pulveribacter sp.]|uniref:conjugative transfer protein MobI(A/C) n=1 Tax=Pulveribacter sp. TaxID=2678893 RepID=UPI0028B0C69D|nr:conjugative transfer protein MobI(A/C) [Pulveribacter sp.]
MEPPHYLDEAMAALRKWQDLVFAEMEALSTNYRMECERVNEQATSYKQRSVLRLQTYRRVAGQGKSNTDGNHLQAKWNRVRFFKSGGKPVREMQSIKKSEGQDCYSMTQLKEYAQDWEWPIVEKLEKQLGLLRRQASFIAQGITQLRYAKMAEDRYNERYVYNDPDDSPSE